MTLRIRPVCDDDIEDLVEIALLAWEPVFPSFQQMLGDKIYTRIWPDWRAGQRKAVEAVCRDGEKTTVLVAELDGTIAGFLAYQLNHEEKTGEVWLLAVHPQFQNQGIASELNTVALKRMKAAGMTLAKVETGGDWSHAPARRSYEKAGYTPLPLVRYFKDLSDT